MYVTYINSNQRNAKIAINEKKESRKRVKKVRGEEKDDRKRERYKRRE